MKSKFRMYAQTEDGETPPMMSPSIGLMLHDRPRAVERAGNAGLNVRRSLIEFFEPPERGTRRVSEPPGAIELLESLARKAGVDPRKSSIADVLMGAWRVAPTDVVGEAIENIAREHGVAPPWQKHGGDQ